MVGGCIVTGGRRRLARTSLAALAALLSLALALIGAPKALAAPTIVISAPEAHSFTSDTTPTIAGTTSYTGSEAEPAPVAVSIYQGESTSGGVVASTTTNPSSDGSWSLTPPALEQGTYTAVAEQSELGEAGTSNAVTFTVDTTSPAVTLEPVASPTADPQPVLSGNVGTEAGDLAAVTVTIYDGSSVGGAVADVGSASVTGGEWSYTPAHLSDGTYTAQATQEDQAGNLGKSQARTFVIKANAPTVTLAAIASPSNDSSPTLQGTAGAAEGDDELIEVTIYHGNSVGGAVAASGDVGRSGSNWSYSAPQLEDGTYTAQAVQKDVTGHTAVSEPLTFTIDTKAPQVTLDAVPTPTAHEAVTLEGARGTEAGDEDAVEVVVYEGESTAGSPLVSAKATVSGASWSYGAHLTEGTYTAQALQRDEAGNVGKSQSRTFTVKTQKPIVTLNQPEAISNDTTPTFSGSADTRAGDIQSVTLKVYAGSEATGKALRTVTVGVSGGLWSAGPVASLPDGTYTAQAQQQDEAGNVGFSAEGTFTINTKAPEISFHAFGPETNDPTPTLSGTRGTAPGDDNTVTVTVYEGTSAGGAAVASSTFAVSGSEWSYAPPHLRDGTYTAQATQEDDAHNIGRAQLTFTVDTVAPHVTLASVPTPSNNATPTLHGAVGTEAGDDSTVAVTIYDGPSIGGAIAASGSVSRNGRAWSYTSPHLADGVYTAQATQEDAAGNTGHSEAQTFTVDTASPVVHLSSPAPLSNDTSPTFSGTANESAPVTVTLFRGSSASGTPLWQATAAVSSGQWESPAVSPALENGTYTVIASEASSLDNPEGKSLPATFKVNISAPTVTLAQPTTPSNNTAPSFTGTASEGTKVTVKVYEGEHPEGKPVGETSANPVDEAWTSGTVQLATSGKHIYTAIATEPSSIGNGEGDSLPATFTVDTTSPTVTLEFERSSLTTNSASPTFKGSASDSPAVTVNVYKGKTVAGLPVASATSAAPVTGSWTTAPSQPPLSEGTYTAQATQASSLGNNPGTSSTVTFTIDKKPPIVTLASINGKAIPAPPTVLAVKSVEEFAGSAGSDKGDLPKLLITITKAGSGGPEPPLEESITLAKGATSWSFKPSDLGEGSYTAQVTQSDEAGNTGASAVVSFAVKDKPPTVTLNAPAEKSNNRNPTFSGTASAPTPVTVDVYYASNNELVATATASVVNGSWVSGTLDHELPVGKAKYYATATQTDEAGNSATTEEVKFTVDSEAPTVTLNQPAARTNDPTPTFTGFASDRTPVTINVYPAGEHLSPRPAPVASATATGTAGAWTSSPVAPPLPDGRYVAIAAQESGFGNHAGESEQVTFTVDTVAPQVTISSPANGGVQAGQTQVVSGSGATGEGDVPEVSVQLFAGEGVSPGQAPIRVAADHLTGSSWSVTLAALPAGAYTVRALQSDEAGNVGSTAPVVFHLTGLPAAAAAAAGKPAASFSWYPSAPHAGEQITLISTATDPSSPLTGFAWDLLGNGSLNPGGEVISTSFATAGNHLVRLRVTDASGATSVVSETIPVSAPALQLMQPFPLVRIVTTRSSSGLRLRLLSIVAAPGVRITITCKGRGCPLKKLSKVASAGSVGLASLSFKRFERLLPVGTTLQIRISRPGLIGKYTGLTVRRGGVLHRVDACLVPNSTDTMPCPSG